MHTDEYKLQRGRGEKSKQSSKQHADQLKSVC